MTLNQTINHHIASIVGSNRAAQKKARLFIGIGAIILANTTLGPIIGHAIAALLGLAVFLVMLDTGDAQ